jgi:hypothetical protein
MMKSSYGEGFAPWREIARWRRLFWLSLAVNVILAGVLLWRAPVSPNRGTAAAGVPSEVLR